MSEEFDAAVARVANVSEDPGAEVKLQLYGLFKQATQGDVQGKRPGFTNPVGRAKYDAWAGFAGLSTEDAQSQYIALVDSL